MAMSSVIEVDGDMLANAFHDISLQDQDGSRAKAEIQGIGGVSHGGVCAICLDEIALQDAALVKGCEHEYCVTCILRWATYSQKPTCPQCKLPFEFLNVHRTLDGSIHDYMFEESVCLLLRATWFKPMVVEEQEDIYDGLEDYYPYEEEGDDGDLDEVYFSSSSSLRIGNRRWGDNGYVRGGRQEARPVYRANMQELEAGSSRQHKKKGPIQESDAGSSREPKKKGPIEDMKTGRRAKRALKREAADKVAAAKHQEHLVRLDRK
ncbi:RING/U-box superfamily protein isoform 1 [Tripterygium wilfordii]|uniref:RING/U-box superfamily protein isoform 1 n=1 Tax=Tripterygium wilfordii TaxID=458696 RepID=A0A7J7C0B2_TRIWF|nr:uncharacterized protein LOC119990622 [Tripterygium wilfordii]KAF5727599.1 RING/U-box superfamily protein isoform 1 [Tripterygium wilfordii]